MLPTTTTTTTIRPQQHSVKIRTRPSSTTNNHGRYLFWSLYTVFGIRMVSTAVATTACTSSSGDQLVGVYAYSDPLCSDATTHEGPGCMEGTNCRLCRAVTTPQSQHLWPCPPGTGPNDDSSGGAGAGGNNPIMTPTATPVYLPPPSQRPTKSPTLPATQQPQSQSQSNTPPPSKLESDTDDDQKNNHDDKNEVLYFDDFNSGLLDTKFFKHEITLAGGGNWEFQVYRNSRKNSFVKDGMLQIRPTLTQDWVPDLGPVNMYGLTPESDCTSAFHYGCEREVANPITSARLNTRSFTFTTGRIEVRTKLPRGDWLWPAIWLLPKYETFGSWPISGEIDLLESTGNAPGYLQNRGVDSMLSVLHWGMSYFENRYEMTKSSYTLPSGSPSFADEFHTFGLRKTEHGLYTYVDDDANRVLDVNWKDESFYERGGWNPNEFDNPWEGGPKGAPFAEQEFYLIINLAVGGISYFDDADPNKPWRNTSPTAAQDFWAARDQWLPTWENNDSTFQIDWINITKH